MNERMFKALAVLAIVGGLVFGVLYPLDRLLHPAAPTQIEQETEE